MATPSGDSSEDTVKENEDVHYRTPLLLPEPPLPPQFLPYRYRYLRRPDYRPDRGRYDVEEIRLAQELAVKEAQQRALLKRDKVDYLSLAEIGKRIGKRAGFAAHEKHVLKPLPDELDDYLSDRDREYSEGLKLGEILVTYGRVMMIGSGGSGKTSLRHGLMKKPLPKLAFSTLLANSLSVKCQWAGASGQRWMEVDEEDEINELATLLSRIIESNSLLKSAESASAIEKFQPFTQPQSGAPESASSSSRDYSDVVEEIRKKVFAKLRRAKLHNQPHSEVLLNVWDSGGQLVFMNVLPAFLTKRTLFMLVFDASQNLEAKLQVNTIRAGKIVHTEDYHLNTTELLMQWMATIDAQLSLRNTDEECDPYPQVMLVGTHLDQLVSKGHNPAVVTRTVLESLHLQYKDKTYADLLMPSSGYIVDNTTAGQDKEDPAFQTIRQYVHKFATTNFTVPTPATWVLFRKVMQRISLADRPVMIYSEVVAIAEACSVPSSAVPSVLNFYHELGVFLYYSKIPSLQKVIIATPQWLVNHMAELLTPRGMEDRGRERQWRLLREKGILTETLYRRVLKDSILPPQALVDLLEHLLLTVPFKTTHIHPYKGKEYFVPCMLKAPSQTTVPQSSKSDESSAPIHLAKHMHLIFDTHYVPPGFYVRLLATVVRNPQCQVLFQQINRFTVTIAYQEVDEITLRDHPDSIEVQVSRAAQGGSHVPPFHQVCQNILTMIQTSIVQVHEWLPGVTVSTAFVCSTCSPEVPKHFVRFDRDTLTTTTARCQNEKLQELSQCQSQQYWLKLQEQSSPHSGTHSAREKRQENYPGDTMQGTTKMPIASSRSTVPKLADVIEHVTTPRWFELGLALGVDDSTLRFIEQDNKRDSRTGLRCMFQEWLSRCEQPSWDNVILALRRIGENRLAAEICHKLKF